MLVSFSTVANSLLGFFSSAYTKAALYIVL